MEKTVTKPAAVKSTSKPAVAKEIKAPVQELKVVVEETTEVVEKVNLGESVNKVVTTAQDINSQIVNAASEVAGDVKEIGLEIKEVATKSIKEVATKVDFSDSVKVVKATATNVNKQIKETATEVVADVKEKGKEVSEATTKLAKEVVAEVKEKGKEMSEATTKLAKEAIENINLSDRLNAIKKAVVNTNTYALETTEELIHGLEANGTKWQNVTEKAIKSGLKLAERQQNIVFSTLEAVKTQITGTGTRFKKLFSNN